MLGTYVSLALILLAAAAIGQGLFSLCGRREWTRLAPAVGLAVLCAVSWGALSLTGDPVSAVTACGLLLAAAGAGAALSWFEAEGHDLAVGLAVLAGAAVLGSLPFLVEGRFGILGTSLNPDMSQHLFAVDRLQSGGEERLIAEGYPLGPHAIVAGLGELGLSSVEAFGGLTLAIAIAASLAALPLLGDLRSGRRIAAALLVGMAYMTASYLVQGAFKETLQALFLLAFAVGLHQLAAGNLGGRGPDDRWRLLAAVPLAALAVGSVYAYSFPGLAWLAGAVGVWAVAEVALARSLAPLRAALVPAAVGVGVFAAAAAPEMGRIADFASFETFDPDGAGLGNLFNPISPLEALGIWPSGDFRLDPGAGFAPAFAFWLGGIVAAAALVYGLAWWLRRGELAVPAALAAAATLYLYALIAGTPYQEAKAIAIAAPLTMLISVRALLVAAPGGGVAALAVVFAIPAAGCSVLALANGPVGPSEWSADLIELRESGSLGSGGSDGDDTLVIAPAEALEDEHGKDLYLWELRGGNVCTAAAGATPARGIENVVGVRGASAFVVRRQRSDGSAQCPYIADGARADPGG